MSRSIKIGLPRLGIKESLYWGFIPVDNYISPILHNQVSLGNNVSYNLLYCGNEKIKKISVEGKTICNSLHIIDSSIDVRVKSKLYFDISEEGKQVIKLKDFRRRDTTIIDESNDNQISREEIIESLL